MTYYFKGLLVIDRKNKHVALYAVRELVGEDKAVFVLIEIIENMKMSYQSHGVHHEYLILLLTISKSLFICLLQIRTVSVRKIIKEISLCYGCLPHLCGSHQHNLSLSFPVLCLLTDQWAIVTVIVWLHGDIGVKTHLQI